MKIFLAILLGIAVANALTTEERNTIRSYIRTEIQSDFDVQPNFVRLGKWHIMLAPLGDFQRLSM